MCGILGTIPSTEKNLFANALHTLAHRGPDDFGIESINNEITLGHRRLSIIDLSQNAHQPMFDLSKRYSLVFNGEIYNFLEIKAELEKKNYRFKSHSDSEVLLNAYIEWGVDCVLKFNGMWAFGIWDSYEKELFLSRDRFGKKPLFYAEVEDKFIFASEMKAIYPFLKEVKPSKDFHWMKNNLFLYEGTEKCLIEGIKRFPAGHNGVYKGKTLTLTRYWNTLDHLEKVPLDYNQQVERFRELFFDACKIRMRSDVTIGTALSGGLDSSSVISALAHLSKNNLDYGKKDWQHAFVASYAGSSLEDSHYAKMVVDHIGINATFVNIDPLKSWDKLEEHFYLFEELHNVPQLSTRMVYECLKSNGISVTLDGHGADELIIGYGHILEALVDNKFNPAKLMDILRTNSETLGLNPNLFQCLKLFLKYVAKKTIKEGLLKHTEKGFFINNIGVSSKSRDENHPNFKKLDNFSRHLYVLFHEVNLPIDLRNYDRNSMINGVEIRMPFMDHRIVSYVNSLPQSSKFGGGYTKKIIRDAMAPYMPKQVTWRKSKMGFSPVAIGWMRTELKEWFLDTVNEKSFLECTLVDDPQKLRDKITNFVNKKNPNYFDFLSASKFWAQLSPYIWEKAVIKRNYAF